MHPIVEDTPHLAMIKLHTADHQSYLRANHLLKPYDITVQQALILDYLSQNSDNNINQKDIEIYLGISNPSVTSLMKALVRKGLVRRLPVRTDARSYMLRLTDRGQQLQTSITQVFSQLAEEIHAGLTDEEQKQFEVLLNKIIENLT